MLKRDPLHGENAGFAFHIRNRVKGPLTMPPEITLGQAGAGGQALPMPCRP
ncbi:hypothetical protein C357_19401 [Citreicella sp. 357]|nr:hypothetical protein C357_19401 [Citreicella sp. 357]